MTRFALVPIGLALALVAGPGASMSKVEAGVPRDERIVANHPPIPQDAAPEVSMSNASAEEVTKAVRAAGPRLMAGKWEIRAEIVSIEMPGAPPEVAESFKKNGQQITAQCYSDDELNAQGGAISNMGTDCMFADFTMGNGSMRGTSTCTLPQGKATSKMKGSYAADKFDYETETSSSMPGGQSIRMTMTITGRRTGGCTPDRKAKLPK